MKRVIFISFLIAISGGLYAQAYKDSVRVQFLRYTDYLIKKDFVRSTDYMNPGFFKIVPKEQLVELIEKTYNNPAVDFNIEKMEILSVGDNKTIEGNHFVKLQYSNYLSMHYKTANEKPLDTALTKMALQEKFGQDNVRYDAEKDTYKVFVVKNVIANSPDLQNWTFVVVEEKQKPILKKFIPKELL